MVFSGGLAISKLRAAAGQSSAARLLWRAGCAVVFFGSPKNEGEQSADRRWRGTPHPMARLAVEPISGSPEITGGIRPPARLSALCCGVFLTASGRAFCGALAPPSANSWQEALVPPGGAPTPPERVLCVQHVRGRRPSPRPGIAGRRLPEDGTESPAPLIRPAPPPRRLSSGAPRRAR